MATEPTPPAAPVTTMLPRAGAIPARSSAMTESMAVYPAVPIAMASRGLMRGGNRTSQSPLTRAFSA